MGSSQGENYMASKLSYKRTTTDKISVKGVLSPDGTFVTYYDDDKNEKEVKIDDLLAPFLDSPIDLSVTLKDEFDLELGENE